MSPVSSSISEQRRHCGPPTPIWCSSVRTAHRGYRLRESVLKVLERFGDLGGTNTAEAVRRHYKKHDRVLIVTDERASFSYAADATAAVPSEVPVYIWNLDGYQVGHAPSGGGNRHTFGGFRTRRSAWCRGWKRAGTPTGPGIADYESGISGPPGADGHGAGRSQGAYSR